jgi:hypothetical protein
VTIAAWPDLRAGLTSLFADLSGIPTLEKPAVSETGTAWVMPGASLASVSWRVSADSAVGRDELRSWYDGTIRPTGDTYVPPEGPPLGSVVYEATGNREITIEVKTEGGNQDAGARDMASRIRDRMALPSSQARYRALGLGLQRPGTMRDVSGLDLSARAVSAYVLEYVFNGASGQVDAGVTTIEAFAWCLCPGGCSP